MIGHKRRTASSSGLYSTGTRRRCRTHRTHPGRRPMLFLPGPPVSATPSALSPLKPLPLSSPRRGGSDVEPVHPSLPRCVHVDSPRGHHFKSTMNSPPGLWSWRAVGVCVRLPANREEAPENDSGAFRAFRLTVLAYFTSIIFLTARFDPASSR